MANDIFALWDKNKTRISDIPDIYTKNKYLLTRNQADAKKDYQELLKKYKFSDMSGYIPSSDTLKIMSSYSFFLQFKFTLATPYISRDDEEFYICDNPIKKDKVFKVPMVSGSSWKGNMRWVMRKNTVLINEDPEMEDNKEIIRLFGNEKDNKKAFNRGRLNFYPTFFNKISLEVINPHDRKTKAGTRPIYTESVPADTDGTFSLLYVPFDLMGKQEGEVKKEVADDLELICTAIGKMMLTYGFSAKKSSGFGIVKDKLNSGQLNIKGIDLPKKDFSDFSMLEKVISTAISLLDNEVTL